MPATTTAAPPRVGWWRARYDLLAAISWATNQSAAWNVGPERYTISRYLRDASARLFNPLTSTGQIEADTAALRNTVPLLRQALEVRERLAEALGGLQFRLAECIAPCTDCGRPTRVGVPIWGSPPPGRVARQIQETLDAAPVRCGNPHCPGSPANSPERRT